MGVYSSLPSTKQQNWSSERSLLSGWKEIANYLGKGVRTAQRYEHKLKLPIRRPAGNCSASVIATREELDAWVAASPKSSEKMRSDCEELGELKSRTVALHQLHTEGRKLRAALRVQRTLLTSNIERIVQTLGPTVSRGEKHRAIAAEQSALAAKMVERVRQMSDQAKEMRQAPRRQLVVNC